MAYSGVGLTKDDYFLMTPSDKNRTQEIFYNTSSINPFLYFLLGRDNINKEYVDIIDKLSTKIGTNYMYLSDVDFSGAGIAEEDVLNSVLMKNVPIIRMKSSRNEVTINGSTFPYEGPEGYNEETYQHSIDDFAIKLLEEERSRTKNPLGWLEFDKIEGDFEENIKNKNFNAILQYAILTREIDYRLPDVNFLKQSLEKGFPLSLLISIVKNNWKSAGFDKQISISSVFNIAAEVPGALVLTGGKDELNPEDLQIFDSIKARLSMGDILGEKPAKKDTQRKTI